MPKQEMTEQEAIRLLRRFAGRRLNNLSRPQLQELVLAQNALLKRWSALKFDMRLVMVQDT